MVTGKRPKDLRGLDRGRVGGNTRGFRHGLRPLSGRSAAAPHHPAHSCRGLRSLARTRHSSSPVGRDRELAQTQATWLVDSCRVGSAGVIFRRSPAAHKRLMILSAVAISDAGFARIWLIGIKTEIPGLFGWWLQYFWGIFLILVAMGVWDLWRRRRIHPAVLFGAALLWAGEIVTTILNFSPAWREIMVRLVNAWGYAG
jgi:hypothetical protein